MARPRTDPRSIKDRERWRQAISIAKNLAVIEKCQKELLSNWRQISGEETTNLRLICDNAFRLLNKCLPDLKAVELSGQVEVTDFRIRANP